MRTGVQTPSPQQGRQDENGPTGARQKLKYHGARSLAGPQLWKGAVCVSGWAAPLPLFSLLRFAATWGGAVGSLPCPCTSFRRKNSKRPPSEVLLREWDVLLRKSPRRYPAY